MMALSITEPQRTPRSEHKTERKMTNQHTMPWRSRSLVPLCLAGSPPPAADAEKVPLDPTPGRIDFRTGGALATSYHVESDAAKPYLWPLNAPGGIPVTRSWPLDKVGAVTTDH